MFAVVMKRLGWRSKGTARIVVPKVLFCSGIGTSSSAGAGVAVDAGAELVDSRRDYDELRAPALRIAWMMLPGARRI